MSLKPRPETGPDPAKSDIQLQKVRGHLASWKSRDSRELSFYGDPDSEDEDRYYFYNDDEDIFCDEARADCNNLAEAIAELLQDALYALKVKETELCHDILSAIAAAEIWSEDRAWEPSENGLALFRETFPAADPIPARLPALLKAIFQQPDLAAEKQARLVLDCLHLSEHSPNRLDLLFRNTKIRRFSPAFEKAWLSCVLLDPAFDAQEKADLFHKTTRKKKPQERNALLQTCAPFCPALFLEAYKEMEHALPPGRRIAWLQNALEQPPLQENSNFNIRLLLLDDLASAWAEKGKRGHASNTQLQAFQAEPSYTRYAKAVFYLPEQSRLKYLYENSCSALSESERLALQVFEGKRAPLQAALKNPESPLFPKAFTLLTGILLGGDLQNAVMKDLLTSLFTPGRLPQRADQNFWLAHFMSAHSVLFARSARLLRLSESQKQQLCTLAGKNLHLYIRSVLSAQCYSEYRLAARLTGALVLLKQAMGEPEPLLSVLQEYRFENGRWHKYGGEFDAVLKKERWKPDYKKLYSKPGPRSR